MSSVDDRLRQAFGTADQEWVRRAPAAHRELRVRHRRHQLVRLGVAAAAVAATVAAVAAVEGDAGTRTVQPADPAPTTPATTSSPALTTPLEGTWTSDRLDASDVRSAARAAGAPGAAAAMLADLPQTPFRVVMTVRGAGISTYARGPGGRLVDLDQETISVEGDLLTVRPFTMPAKTVHTWAIRDDTLTLDFSSTTEPENDSGVPGEAWQRLLYDAATFTR